MERGKAGRKKAKIPTCRSLGLPAAEQCKCCRLRKSKKSGYFCSRITGKWWVYFYFYPDIIAIMQVKFVVHRKKHNFRHEDYDQNVPKQRLRPKLPQIYLKRILTRQNLRPPSNSTTTGVMAERIREDHAAHLIYHPPAVHWVFRQGCVPRWRKLLSTTTTTMNV